MALGTGTDTLPTAGTPVIPGAEEKGSPLGPTSGISSPIPVPQKQTEWESGYQNEHGPRPSRWEAWAQTPFEEAQHGSLASPWGGALLRMAQEQGQASGQMLSADQANKLYPDRPVPYTTSVDQRTALMESEDRRKQQDLQEWAGQRPQTYMGKVVSFASGFAGGMTDPLNFAIGMASGGVSDVLTPKGAGLAGNIAAHYLGNLGGFTATEALQNLVEHQMGAKQKQLPEIIGDNAVPAAIMTGIGVGLHALARQHLDMGGGSSEADVPAIKRTVESFENDQKAPEHPPGGMPGRGPGENLLPGGMPRLSGPPGSTIKTSPLHETPLWAANHSDGTPLVHEHGLGPGIQLTDEHDTANHGVSRSTETPGQIRQVHIPEGAKFLDLDMHPSEAGAQEFLKATGEATAIPPTPIEGSLKEIIKNLGDWAGADLGRDGSIPDNILQRLQGVARSLGYDGYSFTGTDSDGNPSNRQVQLFNMDGVSSSNSHFADPTLTPRPYEPGTNWQSGDMQGPEENIKTVQSPALDKTQDKFYSPEMEQTVHDFHKNPTERAENSPGELSDVEADIQETKKQLQEMSDFSALAREALEEIREQEAMDKRLADISKRIMDCGNGGGV